MSEQIKERLSAFMDGELHDSSFVDQLESDHEVIATWTRYHLIRDVMHRNYMADASVLSQRVASVLRDEPTVLAPRQGKKLLKQASGWAIAATIAAVAILVVRQPEPLPDAQPSLAVGPITQQPVRLTAAAESKLSSYLVSHNESSASSRMKGMLPYTRIISYTPGHSVPQQAVVNAQK